MWPYIQQETQGAALDQVHSLPAKPLPCLSMPRNLTAIILKSDHSSTPETNALSIPPIFTTDSRISTHQLHKPSNEAGDLTAFIITAQAVKGVMQNTPLL